MVSGGNRGWICRSGTFAEGENDLADLYTKIMASVAMLVVRLLCTAALGYHATPTTSPNV